MSAAARFLTALAQAFSSLTLYTEGHPARERAIDTAYSRLLDLMAENPEPGFTFLDGEVVYRQRILRELKAWEWAPRLAGAGIQWLEIDGPVSRAELEEFLDLVLARLSGGGAATAEARQTRVSAIKHGSLGLPDTAGAPAGVAETEGTDPVPFSFVEEAETVRWLQGELKGGHQLPLLEAEAVVRSLSVAMHGDREFLVPLLRLKRFDQYTTTHALNVAVLSMALAEFVGLSPSQVREFGVAGLLHDLGKVKIPEDILNKPGKLSPAEREVMNRHPVEGARMILETEDQLDLAAVVAYEHHIRLDGGGYPRPRVQRPCHQASNLVHVCDVYDALRTHRPYRKAWETERVLSYIREGAGSEFDRGLAHAFVRMMRHFERRVAVLEDEEAPLPVAQRVP